MSASTAILAEREQQQPEAVELPRPRKLTAGKMMTALRNDKRSPAAYALAATTTCAAERVLSELLKQIVRSPELGVFRPSARLGSVPISRVLAAAMGRLDEARQAELAEGLALLIASGVVLEVEGGLTVAVDFEALTAPKPARAAAATPEARAASIAARNRGNGLLSPGPRNGASDEEWSERKAARRRAAEEEEARYRQQTTLKLPIRGGASFVIGTQTGTQMGTQIGTQTEPKPKIAVTFGFDSGFGVGSRVLKETAAAAAEESLLESEIKQQQQHSLPVPPAGARGEPRTEPKPKTEPRSEPKPKTEPRSEPKPKTEPKLSAEPKPELGDLGSAAEPTAAGAVSQQPDWAVAFAEELARHYRWGLHESQQAPTHIEGYLRQGYTPDQLRGVFEAKRSKKTHGAAYLAAPLRDRYPEVLLGSGAKVAPAPSLASEQAIHPDVVRHAEWSKLPVIKQGSMSRVLEVLDMPRNQEQVRLLDAMKNFRGDVMRLIGIERPELWEILGRDPPGEDPPLTDADEEARRSSGRS